MIANDFIQVMILFTGAIALWLLQDSRSSRRRYACLFGLAGQPFWFYILFTSGNWGGLTMTLLYTLVWLRGLWEFWLKPRFYYGEY